MSDDLARIVIGLPVAVLLPLGIPALRQRRSVGALLSAVYAAAVLAASFPDWRAWLLLIVTPVAAIGVAGPAGPAPAGQDAATKELGDGRSLVAAAVVCAGAAALIAGAGDAFDAIGDVLRDDDVWIVTSGLLAAVFLAGVVMVTILAPFTAQLTEEDGVERARGLARAGTYIGWFERAPFFGFIVAGEPQAAAIALTAKSVARFPTLQKHEEGFAEYFLIGSLASLSLAAAMAIGTRAVLGLPAV